MTHTLKYNTLAEMPFSIYLDFVNVYDNRVGIDRDMHLTSLMFGIPVDDVSIMPLDEYFKLKKQVQDFDFSINSDPLDQFVHLGKRYIVEKTATDKQVKQWVDLEMVQSSNFNNPFERFLIIFCLLTKDPTETEYNPVERIARKDMFSSLPVGIVYNVANFFLQKRSKYEKVFQLFTQIKEQNKTVVGTTGWKKSSMKDTQSSTNG